ncbi:MAG TPA: hypothetical protein VEC37_00530 [Bacillota bacterium]|nr:hypothetical protein [Bacillota bacterium]
MRKLVFLGIAGFAFLLTLAGCGDSSGSSSSSPAGGTEFYKLTVTINSPDNPIADMVEIDPVKAQYAKGEKVKLIARPKSGNVFKNWNISPFPENPKEIVMNNNQEVTATFINKPLIQLDNLTLELTIHYQNGAWDFLASVNESTQNFYVTNCDIAIIGKNYSKKCIPEDADFTDYKCRFADSELSEGEPLKIIFDHNDTDSKEITYGELPPLKTGPSTSVHKIFIFKPSILP